MVTYTSARSKLESKLFTPYGSSVTLKTKGTPTFNDWGEETDPDFTESTVDMVSFNNVPGQQSYESFGELESGQMDAAFPYTVTVAVGDHVVFQGNEYEIKNIEPSYLGDGTTSYLIATIVRLNLIT